MAIGEAVLGRNETFRLRAENLILIVGLVAIFMPWDGNSLLIAPALLIAWLHRRRFDLDPKLVGAVALVAAWITVFCIISDDPRRSVKGAYDMVRGALVFFPALLLAARLRAGQATVLLLLTVSCIFLAHFLYPRPDPDGGFFGLHANSNNVAVALVGWGCLWLCSWPSRTALRWWWGAAGALALVLLVLTNGRGAWLGVVAALFAWLLAGPSLSRRIRLLLALAVASGLLGLLLYANYKGFALTYRWEIWSSLVQRTLMHDTWFGFGLNAVKDLAIDPAFERLGVLTAHNIFLEVFVSSGVVGSLSFLVVVGRLLWAFAREAYVHNGVWWAGLAGIIATMVMGMFDLKLASFRFVAAMAMFLALMYGQRRSVSVRAP